MTSDFDEWLKRFLWRRNPPANELASYKQPTEPLEMGDSSE